jgi:hypothetical protein
MFGDTAVCKIHISLRCELIFKSFFVYMLPKPPGRKGFCASVPPVDVD